MDKSTHQVRCEQWTKIINSCLTSGMTKASWCEKNGIDLKRFYYWQRILRNEAYISQKQLPAASGTDTPIAFVELKPARDTPTDTGFHPDVIIRTKGITLEVSNTASPELLKRLGGFFCA